jgi:hypothetical protein
VSEPLSSLDRLVIVDDLRRLQSHLARLASARDWPLLDDLFTRDGQFRAFGADGALECFADTPGIGAVIDRALGEGILITRFSGEEFEILSSTRAESLCSVEHIVLVGPSQAAIRGYGSLNLAYRRSSGPWLIRSAEFTRTAPAR